MTRPHDDTAPVEHDPTGMRELLAGLPDPGPMPPGLVARISAALAEEARVAASRPAQAAPDAVRSLPAAAAAGHEAPPEVTAGSGGATGGRVVPLRRGIRLRHVGVAAAVVAAVGLGGYAVAELTGIPGGGLTTSLDAAGGADSGSAVQEQSDAGARAVAPMAGSGDVVVVISGIDHDSSRLDVTAREVDGRGVVPLPSLAAESPALGPIATPVGARACATALGVPRDAGVLVDVGEVDGAPGAVLVVHGDGGRTAYAVDRSCTSGRTGLIRGPVSLDP